MQLAIATDYLEAEITGDATAFRDLRTALAAFLSSRESRFEVSVSRAATQTEYPWVLKRLRCTAGVGPVYVSVDESVLAVEGGKANLERFISFLEFEDHESGAHRQYEYAPGNTYIQEHSLPLVLSCNSARSA